MIWFLLVTNIFLLIIAFYINQKDIMAPAVIVCSTFIICILCAICNIKEWKIQYHLNSYFIISSCLGIYILIGAYYMSLHKTCKGEGLNDLKKQIIAIEDWKISITIVIDVITFFWYFKEVYRISILGGNSSGLSNMLYYFRMANSYTILSTENAIPMLLNQLIKLNKGFGYIFMFALVNNVICTKHIKKWLIYFVPIVFYILQTLLTSNRWPIIFSMVAALLSAYIIWHRAYGWNYNINMLYLKKGVYLVIVIFIVFYMLQFITKHSFGTGNAAKGFVQYITTYVGGCIQLFDMFMQDVTIKASKFGEETFMAFYSSLASLGFTEKSIRHLEFRSVNGINIGNVYGAFRKYYFDFGIVGTWILTAMHSLIVNILYYKIKNFKVSSKNKRIANFSLLSFIYICQGYFFMPIDDFLFSSILSLNYLSQFIILWVIYNFFINTKIKFI